MNAKLSATNLEKQFAFLFFGICIHHWLKGLLKPTVPSIALGIALGLSTAPAANAYSEVVSFTYDGHSYKAYDNTSPITWTEARTYALSLGGDLVSLDTASENTAVYSFIQYASTPGLWDGDIGPYIGLLQPPGSPEPSGGWKWVDNTLLNYSGWYVVPGFPNFTEPNNGNGADENVGIYFKRSDNWADVYDCDTIAIPCSSGTGLTQPNASRSKSFIVEFNTNVPAPAPILGGMAALGWSRRLRRRIKLVSL